MFGDCLPGVSCKLKGKTGTFMREVYTVSSEQEEEGCAVGVGLVVEELYRGAAVF